MIHSERKACEVHFDADRLCYVALVQIPRVNIRALPEDLNRYINQFLPDFREVLFEIPVHHSTEGHEIPDDSRFIQYGGYYQGGNFVDIEIDKDYAIEAAQQFIGSGPIGYGSAEVDVRDHPLCTNTYKSVSDESLERLRVRLLQLVHPFCQGMILQFEGNTFQVDAQYEPSSNKLIFDYKLILE